MDANRMRTGETIAGIAGVALLIIMFLSWFGLPDTIEAGGVGPMTIAMLLANTLQAAEARAAAQP